MYRKMNIPPEGSDKRTYINWANRILRFCEAQTEGLGRDTRFVVFTRWIPAGMVSHIIAAQHQAGWQLISVGPEPLQEGYSVTFQHAVGNSPKDEIESTSFFIGFRHGRFGFN